LCSTSNVLTVSDPLASEIAETWERIYGEQHNPEDQARGEEKDRWKPKTFNRRNAKDIRSRNAAAFLELQERMAKAQIESATGGTNDDRKSKAETQALEKKDISSLLSRPKQHRKKTRGPICYDCGGKHHMRDCPGKPTKGKKSKK
jgi:hypothetical protein